MSDTTPPKSKSQSYDITKLITSATLVTGISQKTGNKYIVGSVTISSPIGDYELPLDYPDKNAMKVLNTAIEQLENETKADFAEGLKK